MKKIFKKIGLFSFGILAAIGFTACKSKTTKKDTTDKPTTKVTTTANKTSGEDKQDTYTVSGQSMDGVVVKVYTVVNAEKTEITDFTKAIEKGTKLYFSITNSSTKTIKVSLTLGGTAYKSVVVNAGENGEIIGAELTNNIVYSVTETTAVETATLTVSVDHSHDTATEINSVETEILILPWVLTKLLTPRPIPFLLQEIRISHSSYDSNPHKPQESVQMSLSL